jgi:hypothetical protein
MGSNGGTKSGAIAAGLTRIPLQVVVSCGACRVPSDMPGSFLTKRKPLRVCARPGLGDCFSAADLIMYAQNAAADAVTPIDTATRVAGRPINIGFPIGTAIIPSRRTGAALASTN